MAQLMGLGMGLLNWEQNGSVDGFGNGIAELGIEWLS